MTMQGLGRHYRVQRGDEGLASFLPVVLPLTLILVSTVFIEYHS